MANWREHSLRETFCNGETRKRMRDLSRIASKDKRYSPYLRLPYKITKFLKYFKIKFDFEKIVEATKAYFLWLKVVDDEIDEKNKGLSAIKEEIERSLSGKKNRAKGLEELCQNGQTEKSALIIATENFKKVIKKESFPKMKKELEALYTAAVLESDSPTMEEYIASRKEIGRQTANCAYSLIKQYCYAPNTLNKKFYEFFCEIAELGCLVDSAIDIKKDLEKKVLKFSPSFADKMKLYLETTKKTIKLFQKYPGLSKEFLESVRGVIKNRNVN